MVHKIFLLLCISTINIKLGSTQKCQHKLDGESGKITFPVSDQSDKLPNFASKSQDLSNTCIFFKNIDKKKLTLKFKSIALNGASIKIQTIKTTRKLKWKTYKEIAKKDIINIKGFKYVRISVAKNSGSFEMEYTLTVPPVASCQEFTESVKPVRCTKGIKAGSTCSLSCVDGYTPNQYIKISAGKKFTATCRKITARKGVWKPTLNRIVCGKGQKTKKECKKKFELCVPTTRASLQTTAASNEPKKIEPKLSKSTIEVFSTSAPTPRVEEHSSTSKLDVTTTKQIIVAASMDFKSQLSSKLSAQISATQTESLASSRGTEVPSVPVSQSTNAAMTPTISNESTSPTATYTKTLLAEISTVRPTPSSTTSEPTPPPLDILFSRFPELHPDYKDHESDKQPQSTEGLNPTRHTPLVTIPSPSTTAHQDINDSAQSHVVTSTRQSEKRDKISTPNQSTIKNQSTVTEEGRGETSPPTLLPTLTSSVSSQSTSKSLKIEQSTIHSTALIQTTEKQIVIKSSIAPQLTTISTTTSTTRTSTTKPPPLTTTTTTTLSTPAPNKVPFRRLNFGVTIPPPRITTTTTTSTARTEAHTPSQRVVSMSRLLKMCRRRFCGLSIATRKFARTCQSYGGSITKACRWCRSHPAEPCSTTMSFP